MGLFLVTLASQLSNCYISMLRSSGTEKAAWEENRGKLIRHNRDFTSKGVSESSEALYQETVIKTVEKLMLDLEHVENRLIATAQRAGVPDGQGTPANIHHAIKQCDWPNVAESLVRHRELALASLRADQELSTKPKSFRGDAGTQVLRGINDIRTKYFADLSSPTDFTLCNKQENKRRKKKKKTDPLLQGLTRL